MNKEKKIACVILAAGLSKRFGGPKQLARLDENGPSLVQKALDVANSSSADYVILVLGRAASEIMAEIRLGRANLVFNKDFAKGLSTSIKCGLSNMPVDSDAAVIMVGDQPFLTSGILDDMIGAYKEKRRKIVALASAVDASDPRNPVLFDREFFPELSKLNGDVGARRVVLKHIDEAEFMIVDDSVLLDIDSKDALQSARKHQASLAEKGN